MLLRRKVRLPSIFTSVDPSETNRLPPSVTQRRLWIEGQITHQTAHNATHRLLILGQEPLGERVHGGILDAGSTIIYDDLVVPACSIEMHHVHTHGLDICAQDCMDNNYVSVGELVCVCVCEHRLAVN